ncbi:MAG: TetR/AcrR family transcriptional regulator [Armatimonadetes bacterium]|nr:TetR/AcrR family transcriptional regulator [Armatimonadota bacterium]
MKKKSESYRHGSLPQTLVEGALKLLETQTAEELSVRELAELAGVSPRAPYVHFPTKRDLLKAVAVRGFEQLTEAGEAARGDLIALGKVYIRLGLEHPNLYRLMFSGVLDADCTQADESYRQVQEAISARKPDWDEGRVATASLGLWAFVHGLTELQLLGLVSPETWEHVKFEHLAGALGEILRAE